MRHIKYNIKENQSVNFWDFSGNKTFSEMRDEFYKEMNGIILVFDICSRKSFENIELWHKEAKNNGGKDVVFFLVGNKSDCSKTRVVREKESQDWAKMHNIK